MMMRPNKISSQDARFEFEQIKPSEVWRFYIDGYRQLTPDGVQKGSMLFDEGAKGEPGYINAMLNAHLFMCNTLDLPLTPQLIIEFHKLALNGVKNTSNKNLDKFRDRNIAAFGLVMDEGPDNIKKSGNVSVQGLCEFLISLHDNPEDKKIYGIVLNTLRSGGKVFDDALLNKAMDIHSQSGINAAAEYLRKIISAGNVELFIENMTHEVIQAKVWDCISAYTLKLNKAYTENEKLEAIIHLIQGLERLHPFSDGNCRTFAMLLLNRELILNGSHPAMLDNPNRFDLFSISQLNNEIQEGIVYASKFKSDIACLPTFRILYDLLVKQNNAGKLLKILNDIKDMSLPNAINHFSSVLDTFNKGGGLAGAVLGKDIKNYKVATLLLDEMKGIQSLVATLENTSTIKTLALMHEKTKIPYSAMRQTTNQDADVPTAPDEKKVKTAKKVVQKESKPAVTKESDVKENLDIKPVQSHKK